MMRPIAPAQPKIWPETACCSASRPVGSVVTCSAPGRFSINAGTDRTHDYSGHRALTWATTTATIRRAGSSGRAEHVPRPRALRLTEDADHVRAGRRAHPNDAGRRTIDPRGVDVRRSVVHGEGKDDCQWPPRR